MNKMSGRDIFAWCFDFSVPKNQGTGFLAPGTPEHTIFRREHKVFRAEHSFLRVEHTLLRAGHTAIDTILSKSTDADFSCFGAAQDDISGKCSPGLCRGLWSRRKGLIRKPKKNK